MFFVATLQRVTDWSLIEPNIVYNPEFVKKVGIVLTRGVRNLLPP